MKVELTKEQIETLLLSLGRWAEGCVNNQDLKKLGQYLQQNLDKEVSFSYAVLHCFQMGRGFRGKSKIGNTLSEIYKGSGGFVTARILPGDELATDWEML